jgi:uncharacterized protein DUF3108
MNRRIVAFTLGTCFLFLAGLKARNLPSASTVMPTRPDAHRLRTGQFQYQSLYHGKQVGTGTNKILKLPDSGDYDFSAVATFSNGFTGFESQRWECITTPTLEPISATLSFGQDNNNPAIFDLKYNSDRVTGFALSRKGSDAGARRSVDTALPANTFDQRLDWATILASDLQAGRQFEFNVYDPGTGVSRVAVQVGVPESVHVPAGTFDVYRVVYRIEKSGGTEQYEIWSGRSVPRMLVQEKFPNGDVDGLVAFKLDESH